MDDDRDNAHRALLRAAEKMADAQASARPDAALVAALWAEVRAAKAAFCALLDPEDRL